MLEIDSGKMEHYKASGDYAKLLRLLEMVCGQHEQVLFFADSKEINKNRDNLSYILSLACDHELKKLEAYQEQGTKVIYFTERALV